MSVSSNVATKGAGASAGAVAGFFRNPNWLPCGCTPDENCYATFVAAEVRARSLLPATTEDPEAMPKEELPMPLYHIAVLGKGTPEYEAIAADFKGRPGFELDSILEVQNAFPYTQYCIRKEALQMLRGDPNEIVGYHVSKGSLHNICQNGLDQRQARRGVFGRGIYTTSDPMKANDYSTDKGNPETLRMMLRCKVLLGRSKEFPVGHFDRDLVMEPEGYDSTKGFIRRAEEYAVYSSDRVYISHIIFYRFTDSNLELTPSFAVPPNFQGQIAYIPANLWDFFNKLQARDTTPDKTSIKKHIKDLLLRSITVQEFLAQVSVILKTAPPPNLAGQLEIVLQKCKLPQTASTVPGTPQVQDTAQATPSEPEKLEGDSTAPNAKEEDGAPDVKRTR
jgi:Poly(ADP-ribose) polymerase catalytic domain